MAKRALSRLRLLTLLALLAGTSAFAADVKLAWDANTEPDLKGYKVYYGTASGVYGNVEDVGNVTTYTIPGLGSGAYYFVVTAYNDANLESGYSNEVSTLPGPFSVARQTLYLPRFFTSGLAQAASVEPSSSGSQVQAASNPEYVGVALVIRGDPGT